MKLDIVVLELFLFALVPILTCSETLHIEKSRPAITLTAGLFFCPLGGRDGLP